MGVKTFLVVLGGLLILPLCGVGSEFNNLLIQAAVDRTKQSVTYDGSYVVMSYPGGDVPLNQGVCTDLLIRSYRALGIDLQVLVHEDMSAHFHHYPSKRIWGLNKPDRNIDHRRVPNLQAFFSRQGESLPVSDEPKAYFPGDIVTWMLPGNLPHIGLVSDTLSEHSGQYMILHNIGAGPRLEDMLFDYEITGHYRFQPEGHPLNTIRE